MFDETATRRGLLVAAAAAIPAVLNPSLAIAAAEKAGEKAGGKEEGGEEQISPPEDLMREHGALNRILLIYENFMHGLSTSPSAVDGKLIAGSAGIIRTFIEDYHEKQEEQDIFPRFEKAGKLTELVAVLRKQHDAGRAVTKQIIADAPNQKTKSAALIHNLGAFIRMYRPHEAREDTVLFPALRQVVSEKELAEMGEKFEDREHKLFGNHGFEDTVAKIAGIEKQLGIYDLYQFTPNVVSGA